MIDPKALAVFGTTNEQLRTFFTREQQGEKCKKFTEWVRDIIQDGRTHSLRYYRFFAAADLAWDAAPILPENVPLMAYAQKKIDLAVASKELGEMKALDPYIERKEVPKEGGGTEIKESLNLPRLTEVSINIGRSYIGRRADAQDAKYIEQRPFLMYPPRDTSMVGQLRGEAMSQYAEIMSDAYDYKHMQKQCTRDMLKYSRVMLFPACAWERVVQYELVPDEFEEKEIDGKPTKVPRTRERIEREGVPFVKVHPSRIMYDTAYPLATLNTDTGCTWVGFWDVKRYGDIADDPEYFNTDKIAYSTSAGSLLNQHRAYFDLIFSTDPINFPPAPQPAQDPTSGYAGSIDVAAENERAANKHFYSSNNKENAVFVTDLRVKVKPRDWGLGDYPFPVWLRLLVASDDTVIFAEWLPSLPAIYWGHNEDDSRLINLSQLHEMMGLQDQISNVMSQLLLVMKRSLLQVILINSDIFPDTPEGKEAKAKIERSLNGTSYYAQHHLLEVSFKALKDLNINFDAVLKVVSTDPKDSEYIVYAFRAINLILSILERLMMLSPQEQGQPAEREITATENNAIERTTQVKFTSISQSIDEARAAWKRVIFESSQAYAYEAVPPLPVTQRFSEKTIKAAGFTVVPDEGADEQTGRKRGVTIIGSKYKLNHTYLFSSADGSSRSSSTQEAATAIQFLSQVLPLIANDLGKERLFMLINDIFRKIGSFDLKLEVRDGEGDELTVGQSQANDQRIAQIEQGLQQIAGENQELMSAIEKIMQVINGGQALQPEPAAPAPAAA